MTEAEAEVLRAAEEWRDSLPSGYYVGPPFRLIAAVEAMRAEKSVPREADDG